MFYRSLLLLWFGRLFDVFCLVSFLLLLSEARLSVSLLDKKFPRYQPGRPSPTVRKKLPCVSTKAHKVLECYGSLISFCFSMKTLRCAQLRNGSFFFLLFFYVSVGARWRMLLDAMLPHSSRHQLLYRQSTSICIRKGVYKGYNTFTAVLCYLPKL